MLWAAICNASGAPALHGQLVEGMEALDALYAL